MTYADRQFRRHRKGGPVDKNRFNAWTRRSDARKKKAKEAKGAGLLDALLSIWRRGREHGGA